MSWGDKREVHLQVGRCLRARTSLQGSRSHTQCLGLYNDQSHAECARSAIGPSEPTLSSQGLLPGSHRVKEKAHNPKTLASQKSRSGARASSRAQDRGENCSVNAVVLTVLGQSLPDTGAAVRVPGQQGRGDG